MKITLKAAPVASAAAAPAAPDDPEAALPAAQGLPKWMTRNSGQNRPTGWAGQSFEHGASLGLEDEVHALADALTGKFIRPLLYGEKSMDFGDTYNKSMELSAQDRANIKEKHPYTATGLEVAGSLASVGGGAPGAPAAVTAAGEAAPKVATLASKIGQAAKTGAVVGGISGTGEGEGGVVPRLVSGAAGALGGAAVGGALPVLGEMAGGAYKGIRALLGSAPTQEALTKARNIVLTALQRDGVTPHQARGALMRYQASGKPGTLADVGGENTKRLVRDVSSMPGEVAQTAEQTLTGRQIDQPGRVMSNVRQAVTPDIQGSYHENVQGLEQARTTAAAPLYEQAHAVGPIHDDRIASFLQQPEVRQGLREGLTIARLQAQARGTPINWADYAVTGFNEAGDPIIGRVPNMRLLDAAKQGLDQMLEKYRNPTTDRLVLDPHGMALREMRDAFVQHLDDMNPAYARARAAWAGPTEARDAMAHGRNIYNRDAEISGDQLARLSPNDRMFYRLGVVKAIQDKVEQAKGTGQATSDVLKQFWNSDGARNRLRQAFPDQTSFVRFRNLMDQEAAMHDTLTKGLKGSRTGSVIAGQEDATSQQSMGAKFLENLFKPTKYPGLVAEAIRKRGLSSDVQQQLSDILFATGPEDVRRATMGLEQHRAERLLNDVGSANIRRSATTAAAAKAGDLAGSRLLFGEH